jgi:hypothetical protein
MNFLRLGLIFSALAFSFSTFSQQRSTKIDFEDTLVEGVNRQPLDSLSQLSEDRNNKKYRLYRRRAGFRDLHEDLLEELRNLQ